MPLDAGGYDADIVADAISPRHYATFATPLMTDIATHALSPRCLLMSLHTPPLLRCDIAFCRHFIFPAAATCHYADTTLRRNSI